MSILSIEQLLRVHTLEDKDLETASKEDLCSLLRFHKARADKLESFIKRLGKRIGLPPFSTPGEILGDAEEILEEWQDLRRHADTGKVSL